MYVRTAGPDMKKTKCEEHWLALVDKKGIEQWYERKKGVISSTIKDSGRLDISWQP
jgi:hypothetical protein